jgi:hypothetical protein
MRASIIAISLAAFAVGSLAQPAAAAKTKMGCEKGREVWNATEGKCVPGKYSKRSKAAKAKKSDE